MYIPFPDIDSDLAVTKHMYMCQKPGIDKELLKIQSLKPKHMLGMPCRKYELLYAEDEDNPCKKDSFMDLDKTFELFDVCIPKSKLANRDIGSMTYEKIKEKLPTVQYIRLDDYDFLDLNLGCTRFMEY